jgi:hypothetical protein
MIKKIIKKQKTTHISVKTTDAFLQISNVVRYSEIYLNEKDQEPTFFDPLLYLQDFKDFYIKNSEEFNICNREPICDCENTEICKCDEDDYAKVHIKCDIVSNCRCNLDIMIKSKYKLKNEFLWNIFLLEEDSEKSIINLIPIDNIIKFKLPSYAKNVIFTTDDPIKPNKDGIISMQFNYMSFSET